MHPTHRACCQRDLRDLVLRSQINWELPWGEIPASEKAKLFNVVSTFDFFWRLSLKDGYQARERHPILARYANDWATADIVRRYMKNKRGHHYKNGWLDVPDKYTHLKRNSSRRNPEGSRIKRAKAVLAAKKKGPSRQSTVNTANQDQLAGEDMDVGGDEYVFGGGNEEGEGEGDDMYL